MTCADERCVCHQPAAGDGAEIPVGYVQRGGILSRECFPALYVPIRSAAAPKDES